MSTVYLGTSDFAAGILHRLAGTEHRPSLVVTRPDAPRGRGRRLAAPPVADAAAELGIALLQPADVNAPDAVSRIEAEGAGALVVCAFGALVGEALLAHDPLNVHPSLLPRWRGAAPVERAIMAGDAAIGVSIMRIDAGLDSGPVCLQEALTIAPEDTYGTLAARLEDLSATLLLQALEAGEGLQCRPQPETGITYADKITAADRTLDTERPAEENVRVVRALTPHIGARLPLEDGSFLGVRDARVGEDGGLELLEVQPAGGRPMSYADYRRGRGE